ncbi:MAG: AAA family ATPase [Nocardioidaceae bacterium]
MMTRGCPIDPACGPFLVVVTGVPGAGKITLSSALAEELGASLLSLDAIGEHLYEKSGEGLSGFALRLAAETRLADQLNAVPGPVVVDIWIAPMRDAERVRRLPRQSSNAILEVLCRVPPDVAVERYVRRQRGWAASAAR